MSLLSSIGMRLAIGNPGESMWSKSIAPKGERNRTGAYKMRNAERSYERLTNGDLRHLRQCALDKLSEVFKRSPVAHLHRDRLMCLALCQGAAQHYVDGKN